MQGEGLANLAMVLDAGTALVEHDPKDEAELAGRLREIYAGLFKVDFAGYALDSVKRDAPALEAAVFDLYVRLRSQIPRWRERGLMGRSVQVALRDVFRAARYARDMLGEIMHGHPRLGPRDVPYAAFSGPPSFTDLNPTMGTLPVTLRPGDVLLQRGMVHNSAAIARIGDVDSQFSHLAIVTRDERGKLVMVEALIEEGSIVTPLEAALRHGLGRAILFRHRDAELAERAAAMIHAAIVVADGHTKRRIPYDFSMELRGYGDLYCAKLVRLAFSMASDGDCQIPAFPTLLAMENRDFVDRIGVTAIETFAPGDMELEPDFDIVAEWRDFRVTSELRLKDMIMFKLFEWMESYDYRFRPTFQIRLIGWLGWLSARLPSGLQKITRRLAAKVPTNMTSSAIGAVAMLHKTAEMLYADLQRQEAEAIRSTGRQLHPRQVMDLLEAMRRKLGSRIGYVATSRVIVNLEPRQLPAE